MATTKITITLQDDHLEEIRALVAAGQVPNISAFVKHAVGVALNDAAGWREMLQDALRQTGGPLTKKQGLLILLMNFTQLRFAIGVIRSMA